MRLARVVWLSVAAVVLLGLVIAAGRHGKPQTLISGLQTQVALRQTQSAAEATAQTQARRAATVSALETQVASLQVLGTPPGLSPVPATPVAGGPRRAIHRTTEVGERPQSGSTSATHHHISP